MDDLKILHGDQDVLEHIHCKLQSRYGKESPLMVNRGKIHDYLGMQLDYSVDRKVIISMYDYIERLLDEASEDMNGVATTPASHHLFTVNKNLPPGQNACGFLYQTYTRKLIQKIPRSHIKC